VYLRCNIDSADVNEMRYPSSQFLCRRALDVCVSVLCRNRARAFDAVATEIIDFRATLGIGFRWFR
jgi:hypothetical protein